MKLKHVCAHCGSEEIFVDAWAQWDVDKQAFELASTFDATYCTECENACDVNEIEISAEEETMRIAGLDAKPISARPANDANDDDNVSSFMQSWQLPEERGPSPAHVLQEIAKLIWAWPMKPEEGK